MGGFFLKEDIRSVMLNEFEKQVDEIISFSSNESNFNQIINLINHQKNCWRVCRFDIQNLGNEFNRINILENFNNLYIDFPSWFRNHQGQGCQIQGSVTALNLKFQCVNDGTLRMGNPLIICSKCHTILVDDQMVEINDIINQYNPLVILIEDKSNGSSLIQDLQVNMNNIIPIKPLKSKEYRVNQILTMFEAGNILFAKNQDWLEELEAEILSFPNCKHDDQLDTISQFINWYNDTKRSQNNNVRIRNF